MDEQNTALTVRSDDSPAAPQAVQKPDYITITSDDLTFHLEIFEGPLDLLLGLIAKNKVNIYDIPIALILEQYMEYIHQMDLFNLEVASEFIVMAAQLMVIKSRLLLPKTQEAEEDPRKELVDLLLEYKRAKQAAEILHELEFAYGGRFEKPPTVLDSAPEKEYKLTHELRVLTEAYRRVYERSIERMESRQNAEKLDTLIRTTRHVSVNEKIKHVLNRLSVSGRCDFSGLFAHAQSRNEIVATFLAVLELIKGKRLLVDNLSEDCENCELVLVDGEPDSQELSEIADAEASFPPPTHEFE